MSAPDLIGYLNRITAVYGLGADEFLDLFEKQGHTCAVCRRPLTLFASDLAEAPVVDHDHATGEVRALLCRGCNTAVGYIEKDRDRTRSVLRYLTRHAKRRSETWGEKKAAGRGGWARANRQEQGLLHALDKSATRP